QPKCDLLNLFCNVIKNVFSIIKNLRSLHLILIIFCIGSAVYFNSLFNDLVIDDFGLIRTSPLVHSITNIPKLFSTGLFYDEGAGTNNYYRPLTNVSYTLIYSAF